VLTVLGTAVAWQKAQMLQYLLAQHVIAFIKPEDLASHSTKARIPSLSRHLAADDHQVLRATRSRLAPSSFAFGTRLRLCMSLAAIMPKSTDRCQETLFLK